MAYFTLNQERILFLSPLPRSPEDSVHCRLRMHGQASGRDPGRVLLPFRPCVESLQGVSGQQTGNPASLDGILRPQADDYKVMFHGPVVRGQGRHQARSGLVGGTGLQAGDLGDVAQERIAVAHV